MADSIGTADYPVAILEDRYNGVYSGGQWLAISKATDKHNGSKKTRLEFISSDGPSADDATCMKFWESAPEWIAVGATPNNAVENLCEARF